MLISRMGVRSRMMVLIAAAMLPLTVLIGTGILVSYEEADQAARASLLFEARSGANEFARAFDEAKASLALLRTMPELVSDNRSVCDERLAQIERQSQLFLTIGVIDSTGSITCHSKIHTSQTFADADLSRRVMEAAPDSFVVGRFMIGPVSKKPTVAVAMSITLASGKPERAVFGSLNLEWLEALAEHLSGPDHHTVALIEPDTDRVLVRWPNTVAFGTAFPGHPLIAELRANPKGGTTDSIGFDRVPRFYGFAPVAIAGGKYLQLAIGAPKEIAFAAVNSRSRWAIGIALTTIALVLAVTWWIAKATQLKPIRRLTAAADRIGSADFSKAAGVERWQAREFRHLGETLDMAANKLAAAHEADQIIVASERRFRLLADNTADMITCIDKDGRRNFVSGASREILGFEPDELIGLHPIDIVIAEDRVIVETMMQRIGASGSASTARYRVSRKDGRIIHIEVSGRPIADGSGHVFSTRDVSERQAVEERLAIANRKLAALASTDELTGLANRRAFNSVLANEMARSLRERTDLSLLIIDVDRFKAYNDRYGHPAGDTCLQKIAATIGGELRHSSDVAARYGGEEFAVVLPYTDPEGALHCAETVREAVRSLALPHDRSDKGIVTISVGVSTFVATHTTSLADAELVHRADEALYVAKNGGRDQVRSSEESINSRVTEDPASIAAGS